MAVTVEGVGPDAPVVEEDGGGRQSALAFDPTLLPARALIRVAQVMTKGSAKYGRDNWRLIPAEQHLAHAQQHYLAMAAGDAQDDHAGHLATRILMWLEQLLQGIVVTQAPEDWRLGLARAEVEERVRAKLASREGCKVA